MLVCTLGDLTLDVVVRLGAELTVGDDAPAKIAVAPGGQAANVAAWAAALGAEARFVGKTGTDEAGALARSGLVERGVDVVGPAAGRNAVICSLVSPGGERSLASDPGASADLADEELDVGWFHHCDHLFVSGYALLRPLARGAALRAATLARAASAAVSVDLASWSAIQDAGSAPHRRVVEELAPDVVFATAAEEDALGGPLPGARRILKLGAQGCSFEGDVRPAPSVRVLDSTGAGDALAAGWIVGGPELALDAAARCLQRLGAMP